MKFLVFAIICATLLQYGTAWRCPVCENLECNQDSLTTERCTPENSELPFQMYNSLDEKNSKKYQCLDVSYYQEETQITRKQCILVDPELDLCEEIGKDIQVDSCQTGPAQSEADDQPVGNAPALTGSSEPSSNPTVLTTESTAESDTTEIETTTTTDTAETTSESPTSEIPTTTTTTAKTTTAKTTTTVKPPPPPTTTTTVKPTATTKVTTPTSAPVTTKSTNPTAPTESSEPSSTFEPTTPYSPTTPGGDGGGASIVHLAPLTLLALVLGYVVL